MDVNKIIKDIISNNVGVSEITLKEFPQRELLQNRIKLDDKEMVTMSDALKMRQNYKLPFWECLVATYIDGSNYSSRLLEDAAFHNKFINEISICQPDLGNIEYIFIDNIDRRLALSSKVKLENNTTMHIPMIDFHIPAAQPFPEILVDIVNLLGQKEGYFLESGESYHFYGLKLITYEEMILFLAKALRFSPIVDRAWISHQFEEKSCALRIGYKNGVLPKIVRYID